MSGFRKVIAQQTVKSALGNAMSREGDRKTLVGAEAFEIFSRGTRAKDPLIKMLVSNHNVRDYIGIPVGFAVLLDPCFRENVVNVPAGGFAQPGVVELDETVGLQIARAFGSEQTKDGFGEGVVDGEGLRPEGVGGDLEVLPFVRWPFTLGDGLHFLEVGDYFDAHTG